jgi:diacylglycerol kinase family enzyme
LSETFDVETIWPTSPDEVEAAALAGAHRGVDVVVAMGGDGVVHHVVNGIVDTPAALGIIPAGTTNVLARILGIPEKPAAAARYLASHPPAVQAPLAAVTLTRGDTTTVRYATFATGIGFDATVVEASNAEPYRKYWFGGIHYARTAVSVLVSEELRSLRRMSLRIGDTRYEATSVLIQNHDPYTYFGKLPLRVLGRRPDGFAVLVVRRFSLLRAVAVLVAAVLGRGMDRVPGVAVVADVSDLVVTADRPVPLQADGEFLGHVDAAAFTSRPRALRVLAPWSLSDDPPVQRATDPTG